jgi:hypothetical protein
MFPKVKTTVNRRFHMGTTQRLTEAIAFRTDPKLRAFLEEESERRGTTVSKLINAMVREMRPLPKEIGDMPWQFAKDVGLPVDYTLSCIVTDWLAKAAAQVENLGDPISNPFYFVGQGELVTDFLELFGVLFQEERERIYGDLDLAEKALAFRRRRLAAHKGETDETDEDA